jgi:hypothetical protein
MKIIILTLFFSLGTIISFAQEFDSSSISNANIVSRIAIDPDYPSIQVSRIGGKWKNKVGASIPFLSGNIHKTEFSISIDPFVEIHDFSPNNDFSWQLWRGSLGMNISWIVNVDNHTSFIIPTTIILHAGYFHESEHATSSDFTTEFTNYFFFESFPNGTFGSFEYIKATAGSVHVINSSSMVYLSLGCKYFPQPIEGGASRELKNALSVQTAFNHMLNESFSTYASAYFEMIGTNFDAASNKFKSNFSRGTLYYRTVEFGVEFPLPRDAHASPFLMYTHSSGRGLDFLENYDDFGGGVRVIL